MRLLGAGTLTRGGNICGGGDPGGGDGGGNRSSSSVSELSDSTGGRGFLIIFTCEQRTRNASVSLVRSFFRPPFAACFPRPSASPLSEGWMPPFRKQAGLVLWMLVRGRAVTGAFVAGLSLAQSGACCLPEKHNQNQQSFVSDVFGSSSSESPKCSLGLPSSNFFVVNTIPLKLNCFSGGLVEDSSSMVCSFEVSSTVSCFGSSTAEVLSQDGGKTILSKSTFISILAELEIFISAEFEIFVSTEFETDASSIADGGLCNIAFDGMTSRSTVDKGGIITFGVCIAGMRSRSTVTKGFVTSIFGDGTGTGFISLTSVGIGMNVSLASDMLLIDIGIDFSGSSATFEVTAFRNSSYSFSKEALLAVKSMILLLLFFSDWTDCVETESVSDFGVLTFMIHVWFIQNYPNPTATLDFCAFDIFDSPVQREA
nr:unnamed protein product [Callosobruchus chinensis]